MKKKIIILFASLIICYILFVTIDSFRIKNNSFKNIKPLITISESRNNKSINYTGLGYTVKYNIDTNYNQDSNNNEVTIYGAEFRLFNKILIWAYIS